MPLRQNVGSLVTLAARRAPDRIGILWKDKTWTYRQINFRVNSLANGLKKIGIRKGDRIAILGYNSNQVVECSLAIYKMGAVTVPINVRLLPQEAAYQVQDSGASAIIFESSVQPHIAEAAKTSPGLKHQICWGESLPGQRSYEQFLKEFSTEDDQDTEVDRDDLAWLFYTSGTTGRPKGAMLTHGVLMEMLLGELADLCPADSNSVCLHVGLLSHGSFALFLPILAKAGLNIIFPQTNFEVELFCQLVQKHKISIMFMVPTMIKMLIDFPNLSRYDLSSLQYIVYGAAPMYVEDMKKALSKLGPVFVQLFGQGETPMTGTYLPREDHILNGTPEQMKRLGSAGFPRTGIEIKVVDEDDRTLPAGEMGEICVRGDTMMKGYWNRPEETAQTLKGGWVHTGDIGYMDRDGYLYIMDRLKDMYISGGYNVYPREIEEVIMEHPLVSEVCVFGVPDEKWGEAGKAVVVLRSNAKATENEVLDFCKSRLAGYKRPKSVDFVVGLPKSAYGKILKREIREEYWKGQERRVR